MSGLYKISTISERTGFSPTLLRAWERRYQFLEPVRQPSGHRFYTQDDLRVLLSVKRLIAQGRAVGEAAALGRSALLEMKGAELSAFPRSTVSNESVDHDCMERLVEATRRLDQAEIRTRLDQLFAAGPQDLGTRSAVRRLGQEIGRLWQDGGLSVACEHMLSAALKERLILATSSLKPTSCSEPPVICAAFPDEWHELGLLFLYYELVRAGQHAIYLGPALPWEDLDLAIGQLNARAVCLSVTRKAIVDVHLDSFASLRARHPGVAFTVGGAGCMGLEQKLERFGVKVLGPDFCLSQLLEESDFE